MPSPGTSPNFARADHYHGPLPTPEPHIGKIHRALPFNFSSSVALATEDALPAAGGSVAVAIAVIAPMSLQDVVVRNTNAASARTWGWDLYKDIGTDTLTRVAASSANETFTPGAASNRIITASGAPVSLEPGLYWVVIQNRHATNTFGLAFTAAASGFGPNANQTKTTTNPNGAGLDFVAATWTKNGNVYGVVLRGRVFGQATAF